MLAVECQGNAGTNKVYDTVNNIAFILKAAEVLAEQLHHLVLHCSLKLDRSSNRRPSSWI